MTRWQDISNLVLGLWLLLSPWIFGYASTSAAVGNGVVVGIVVAVLALTHMRGGPLWEEWVSLVLGIWLVLSPWLLGFSSLSVPTWNAVVVGVLVAILALTATRQKPTHA